MPSPPEPRPGAAQPNRKCEKIWTLPAIVGSLQSLSWKHGGVGYVERAAYALPLIHEYPRNNHLIILYLNLSSR